MGFRRKGREYALQLLFQADVGERARREAVPPTRFDAFWAQRNASADVRGFAEVLVRGVESRAADVDRILERHAHHWSLERMAAVDRNALRLAVYELFYLTDVPPRVVLNEAIDIAKKYGSEESGRFVNGVLDDILKTEPALQSRRDAPDHVETPRR